jgi:hypothetical protein
MEDKTMRKMMMAALFTAACGSITTPPAGNTNGSDTGSDMGSDTGSDMGSDMGSGSGSTLGMACSSATDCGTDEACDIGQHVCVAATFTIDKTGFIDDGTRWWTSRGNPSLAGTIADPAGASLEAYIGTTKVGTAIINGTAWAIQLPANSIAETDTLVTLRLVTSTTTIEESQVFALDDKAPTATLVGSIKDERGDTIDFSTGEAVHTHAGAAIDLSGTGCPSVYTYGYLMDETPPTYGRETAPNPLAWQITVADSTGIDSMDSAYRVRDVSGAVLYDWTSISPDASGVYAVRLFRNKIPALGSKTGHMFVDARFRDPFGNESTKSVCFDNHPMAAPFEIETMQKATVFGWTLAGDSPISTLSIYTPGATLYSQHVVQYANEPVKVSVGAPGAAITYSRTAVDHFVATGTATGFACPDPSSPCDGGAAPTNGPDDVLTNDAVPGGSTFWYATVIDEADGHTVVARSDNGAVFTMPARSSGTPHSYRIDFNLGVSDWYLAPPRAGLTSSIGEFSLNYVTYTGWNPTAGPKTCSHSTCRLLSSGDPLCTCTTGTAYSEYRALQSMSVSFGAYTQQYTSATSTAAFEPVAAYASSAVHVPAMTWNAGTDTLPQ